MAVTVNAVRNSLPHIFIFPEIKYCLQDILFVVYLELALKNEQITMTNIRDICHVYAALHFTNPIASARPRQPFRYKLILTRAIRLE